MTNKEAERIVEEVAAKLVEHFDAVQVLVSWNVDGLTTCVKRGAGNWYARQGMAHEFINQDIAQEQAHQIGEKIRRDEPPEGDGWKKET